LSAWTNPCKASFLLTFSLSRSSLFPTSAKSELEPLSSDGHFLKGSSASLGVHKVQDACEKIQNYGKLWDAEREEAITQAVALDLIKSLLVLAKKEYSVAESTFRDWYRTKGIPSDSDSEEAD
jgi:osomolarity two-component system, phosphorelay intermediate protein YPD1